MKHTIYTLIYLFIYEILAPWSYGGHGMATAMAMAMAICIMATAMAMVIAMAWQWQFHGYCINMLFDPNMATTWIALRGPNRAQNSNTTS